MFETSENTGSLSREIKDIKKNQIKIWELKKYNSGNKVSGCNNRMKGRKERINKVETRTVEMTSLNNTEKRDRMTTNKQTNIQGHMGV